MSTYLRTTRSRLHPYEDNNSLLWDYLKFSVEETQKLSLRSANIYYVNVRLYLRYLKAIRRDISLDIYDTIKINDISQDEVLSTTKEDVEGYIAFRKDRGDTELSLRQKLTCLYAFYSYLVNRKLLEKNPLEEIPRPTPKRQKPSVLTKDEIHLLLKTVFEGQYGVRDYCLTSLLIFSGLSLSELCRLNVSHVKDAPETGLITTDRQGEEQKLSLNQACREGIKDWLEFRSTLKLEPSEQALFVSPLTKRRITARRVENIITDSLAISGLLGKGYNLTTLRNTGALMQFKKGASTEDITHLLGHENQRSTRQLLKVLVKSDSDTEKEENI